MANTYENLALDDNFGTDAEYQAFTQAFEAAILASGFLEVAPDTGQANLATHVRPAVGAYSGYRIYRGKDALQATKPIFVKVEFGVSGSGVDKYQIRKTLSTATNGAGTPSGVVSAAGTFGAGAVGSGAAQMFGGGGSSAAFVYIVDPGNANLNMIWLFGRLRDSADGSASGDILFDMFQSAAGLIFGQTYLWTDLSAAWATEASPGLAKHMVDLTPNIHNGGNVNTTRLFQALVYRNAKTLAFPLLGGRSAELPFTDPTSSKFSLAVWGGNHTFLPIAQIGPVNNRLCLLWE